VLILDMIEVLPPLGKYKYDTWRILPVKCYINNYVCLWSCIRNVNSRVLCGRMIERSSDTLCGLHHARGDEEHEFLG
jgi:hypothetical protein